MDADLKLTDFRAPARDDDLSPSVGQPSEVFGLMNCTFPMIDLDSKKLLYK